MGTEGQDKLIMLPLNFMNTEQVKSTINAMWNFKRINSYKNVTLRNDGSHLTNLYVYDTSSIRYQDKGIIK